MASHPGDGLTPLKVPLKHHDQCRARGHSHGHRRYPRRSIRRRFSSRDARSTGAYTCLGHREERTRATALAIRVDGTSTGQNPPASKSAASGSIIGSANAASHIQIEVVEEQVGNIDPKTNFRLIVIQTELERFKFLVRSFLRTRMAKIDKYTLYLLTNPTQSARLSSSELQYAHSHQALLEAHYRTSFLSQFPTSLQRLDDTAGGISMIEQPDIDKAVFVRGLRDVEDPIIVEGTDIDFEMRRGEVYVVRWSAVRDLVMNGDAELV
ncbi:MAG: hypothetical protein LQ338_007706 [Usnochroma carphineum]|nr:MAG: hypothetical protein LQ338_007706 [Usnochroma carphineum]